MLHDDITFIDNVCDGQCGPEIYDYFKDCDQDGVPVLDYLCATPASGGTRCKAALYEASETEQVIFQECATGCSSTCNSTINAQISAHGCCFYTYYGLAVGTDIASRLFSSCSADTTVCDGGFSNETIPLPAVVAYSSGNGDVNNGTINTNGSVDRNFCPSVSIDEIPDACHNFLELDKILLSASTNPAEFVSSFCTGECAKPLYDYLKECDKVSKESNAPLLDLLCTSNPDKTNVNCASILSDPSVQSTIDGVCHDVNSESDGCPAGCGTSLQTISDKFGCCFYTRLALLLGAINVNDVVDKCGVENAGACKMGALSGDVIDVTGGGDGDGDGDGDRDSNGNDDDNDSTTAIRASAITSFTTLLLLTTSFCM